MPRPLRKALLLALLALAAVTFSVPAVSAHTRLVKSTPASDAVLDTEPATVILEFLGPVQTAYGDPIRVVGPDGKRVDKGDAVVDSETVTIDVDAGDVGSYIVDYRVVSLDGHPINGSYTFAVGEKSSVNTKALSRPATGETMSFTYDVGRALSLLCVLLVAGGGVFALVIAPTWRPTMLTPLLIVGIVASIVTFFADVALSSGLSLNKVLVWDAISAEAETPLGRGMVIRIALMVLVLLLAPALGRTRSQVLMLGATFAFVLLAATQSLTGHALGDDSLGLRLPLAMLHSTAAAVWVGGLAQFRMYMGHGNIRYDEVARFSRMVLVAVALLVITGAYAAWWEIGLEWSDLTGTLYGRIFLLKLGLFASAIPLAMVNRSTNLPEVERGSSLGPMHLRRYVRSELFILAAVIAVTVWLVHTPPPVSQG